MAFETLLGVIGEALENDDGKVQSNDLDNREDEIIEYLRAHPKLIIFAQEMDTRQTKAIEGSKHIPHSKEAMQLARVATTALALGLVALQATEREAK